MKLYAEIHHTEQSYLRGLENLLNVFLIPLSQVAVHDRVNKDAFKQVIADITLIFTVNTKLLERLSERLKDSDDVDKIIVSDIFLDLVTRYL